jgi:cobalt/nickel transport system permease protein
MHMADTLLSPAVGGVMWAATAGVTAYSAKKLKKDFDERKVPLMGVLGAFVFAAQMINFSIPGTGSSGHLGGGMLLAILLGPYAGFLTIASVLVVQALFFADGGLLALGANIFNLGFFPCFIAYPLIFRSIAVGKLPGEPLEKGSLYGRRVVPASILASVVGLQLGALGVVLETVSSGITELSFTHFLLLMQPIHLAIGVVEGIVTAGVVLYVLKAKPELIEGAFSGRRRAAQARAAASFSSSAPRVHVTSASGGLSLRNVLIVFGLLTVMTGGVFSWFASTHPDGLEWSVFRVTGTEQVESRESTIHHLLGRFQEKTAVLPDYGFHAAGPADLPDVKSAEVSAPAEKTVGSVPAAGKTTSGTAREKVPVGAGWPAVDSGTTVSGIVGALLTLLLAVVAGFIVMRRVVNGKDRKSSR